jgi:DNA-binding protein YbaB
MMSYDAVSAAARESMQAYYEEAKRLAGKQVEARSEDGGITARVTADGTLVSLTVRPDALRTYDSATLAELITQTIRDGQLRARADYEQAVAAAVPGSVTAATDIVRSALRTGQQQRYS